MNIKLREKPPGRTAHLDHGQQELANAMKHVAMLHEYFRSPCAAKLNQWACKDT